MGKEKIPFSLYELLTKLTRDRAMRTSTQSELDEIIEPADVDRLIQDEKKLRRSLDKL